MARADLREWALKGAEQRLVEIAAEAARIYAEFPELRDSNGASVPAITSTGDKPRLRKRRSLASRKRMAEAQRKRWAAVRAKGRTTLQVQARGAKRSS